MLAHLCLACSPFPDMQFVSRATHLPIAPACACVIERSGARLFDAILDRRLENVQVNVLQRLELDAVSGDMRVADGMCVLLIQIMLVVDAHDVDGQPGRVRADPDLVELPGLSVGVFLAQCPKTDVGIGYNLSAFVGPIEKPEPATGIHFQDGAVKFPHVALF